MPKIDPASTSFSNLFPEILYDDESRGLSLDIWNNYKITINPISDAVDTYFMYQVKRGDSITLLSNTYYGTTRLWWIILIANDAQDPFDFLENVLDGSEGSNGMIKIYKKQVVDQLMYDIQRNKITQSTDSKYNN